MGSDQLFEVARARLSGGELPNAELAAPFVDVLPVSGTAVSTIGGLLGNETVSASDLQAARLDELQFDLGEGPCWDALRARTPVHEPDMAGGGARRWPAFADAVRDDPVGSIFAFPMLLGPLRLGAIDMYSRLPLRLDPQQTRQATELADLVGRQLLRRALTGMADDYAEIDTNPFSRRIIHQATGMVLVQLDISADDAYLVIQSHAFASDRSMMEIAQEVIDRRLDFSALDDGIEDAP